MISNTAMVRRPGIMGALHSKVTMRRLKRLDMVDMTGLMEAITKETSRTQCSRA